MGRPTSVTEASGITNLAYNPHTGEMSTTYASGHSLLPGISVSVSPANAGRPGGYTLSQQGQPANLMAVSYGYDDAGRLETIQSGNNTVDYQYYPGTGIVHQTTHSLTGGGVPRIETRHVDLAGRTTGVITTVPKAGGGRNTAASAGYLYNSRGQRERLTREDGSTWHYGYNDRGEVISGVKRLANGNLAAGMQFGYHYDAIGNREWAKSGGDTSGVNLRTTTYERNALNQYSSITTPDSFDVLVRSATSVQVLADGTPAPVSSQGSFHRAEVTASNTANGAWVDLDISSSSGSESGYRWVSPASFNPGQNGSGELNHYDKDGNVLTDGRWTYAWDSLNRLVSMTTTQTAANVGVPKQKLEFSYDWIGRRIAKKVSTWGGSSWTVAEERRFVYDGWNLIGEFKLISSTVTLEKTYLWGLDLSGTPQGAGGIGGLSTVNTLYPTPSTSYPSYDVNGNVVAWTSPSGNLQQRLDYDPFGNILTRESSGSFSAPPFGFSTKYQDSESGLWYYGYRYYDPVNGRWLSRDPLGEWGGTNLMGFIRNDGINYWDILGLMLDGPCACKDDLGNYKDVEFSMDTTTLMDTYAVQDPVGTIKSSLTGYLEWAGGEAADEKTKRSILRKASDAIGRFTSSFASYSKALNAIHETQSGLTVRGVTVNVKLKICGEVEGKIDYHDETGFGEWGSDTGLSFIDPGQRKMIPGAYMTALTNAAEDVASKIKKSKGK